MMEENSSTSERPVEDLRKAKDFRLPSERFGSGSPFHFTGSHFATGSAAGLALVIE
jgi:hypothetical protein